MTFPVLPKTSSYVEPRASIWYLIAENGIFQVRDTPTYRSVTRITGPIPGLLPESEHVRLRFPRLPRAAIEDVIALFDEVYRRCRGEAMALVFYDPAASRFHIEVPPQVLPGQRRADGRWIAEHAVVYGSVPAPERMVRLGTIHSHGAVAAYASEQDCSDERYEDGLHIVFGSFDQHEPTVAAAFAADGSRFPLAPAEVLEPYEGLAREVRADWLARVTLQWRDPEDAVARGAVDADEQSPHREGPHEGEGKHGKSAARHSRG